MQNVRIMINLKNANLNVFQKKKQSNRTEEQKIEIENSHKHVVLNIKELKAYLDIYYYCASIYTHKKFKDFSLKTTVKKK